MFTEFICLFHLYTSLEICINSFSTLTFDCFTNAINIKCVLQQESWICSHDKKKKSFTVLQISSLVTGYSQLSGGSPYNKEQVMESCGGFHFFFFLFRAFHSPSWVAKLPKSSFTFLFLSASLKHTMCKRLDSLSLNILFHLNVGTVFYPHLLMISLSFSLARKRESFLISLRAPLNSFLYLCFSRSFSLSSLVLPRFFP